jgi:hypothetical protein
VALTPEIVEIYRARCKVRSRINARRRGSAAHVFIAVDADRQAARIVSALCGADRGPMLREQALIIADARLAICASAARD